MSHRNGVNQKVPGPGEAAGPSAAGWVSHSSAAAWRDLLQCEPQRLRKCLGVGSAAEKHKRFLQGRGQKTCWKQRRTCWFIPQCDMEKWIEIYKSSNFPPSQTVSGWWFGTWILFFHILGDCHHPNWRTPSFFRGVGWNHQPVDG